MKRFTASLIRLLIVGLLALTPLLDLKGAAAAPQGQAPPRLELRFQRATYDPLLESPDVAPALLRQGYDGEGTGYYLVQFHGPIEEKWKAELQAFGATVHDYVPQFAYVVRADAEILAKVRDLDVVRWVGLYQPAFRLSTALDVELAKGDGESRVVLRSFAGESASTLAAQLADLGGKVADRGQDTGGGTLFKLTLPASTLLQAARLEGVAWIEPWEEPRLHNAVARSAVAMNQDAVESALGLYGADQIVVVGDTGVSTGDAATVHADFEGRLFRGTWGPGTCGSWSDYYGHGTHVAGSVLGSGLLSGADPATHSYAGTNAGIAPEALLWAWGFCDDWTGLPDTDPYNDYYATMYDEDPRVRVNTNSWGYNSTSGSYNSFSRETDRFIWDHDDMMVVFSAGNDGIDGDGDGVVDENSMGVPAGAKNILTVGASENYRLSGGYNPGGPCDSWGSCWPSDYPANPVKDDPLSDDVSGMVAFSSRGPVQDGRLKPDVVAPGSNIVSTRHQGGSADPLWGVYDANYSYCGGTSMSAPLAAGATAVVRQYYQDVQGLATPSAALVKATLINGAYDMTPGQYRDEVPDGSADDVLRRPDLNQGWGRVDLENSLVHELPYMLWFEDEATGLLTGESYETALSISAADHPLRVTLAWADYPGTEATAGALVNDLDLEVVAPDGTTYYGNDLVDDGAQDGDVDRVNNVEGVDLVPTPGHYTVRVTGYNVPQGPQPFALVVSGDMGALGYLDGTVTTGGVPLPDASVRAITGTIAYQATTDAGGYYTLPVAADTYTLSAWKYGYGQETLSGVVVNEDDVVTNDFELSSVAQHSLSGCVTDDFTGEPLAAQLTVLGPFGEVVTETTIPQDTGCYDLTLYGGSYTLYVEARLHQDAEVAITLDADTVRDFTLAATTSDGLLWGTITNAETGQPVEGATILTQPGGETTLSEVDGGYELQLPPGAYTVTVSAPLYSTLSEGNVTVPQSNLVQRDYALPTSRMALLPAEGVSVSLPMGEGVSATLTISNGGAGALEFETLELPPSGGLPYALEDAGGPDPFGYTYRDNHEADGPLFEWLDATGGTPLDLSDDAEINVTLPFDFDFYGATSTDLRVGNNGAVLFDAISGDVGTGNSDLGTNTLEDLIAPFWDDIDDERGNVYFEVFGAPGSRKAVIEWHDRPHYRSGGGIGEATFELILYEGTHNIKFQYQDVAFGDAAYDFGASATVGIRQSGSDYLQYSHNTPVLEDGLAICFQYPGSPPCDLRDIPWFTPSPVSGTVASDATLPMTLGFDADAVAQPGSYYATLRLLTNDPAAQPYVDQAITMTVEAPATWGQISGTVTGAREGIPLSGAFVEMLQGGTTVYSVTTALDGSYERWAPAGTYDLRASRAGYLEVTEPGVTITAGATTSHDVTLTPTEPAIAVSPSSLTSDQHLNRVVTHTLVISNTGGATLDFEMLEIAPAMLANGAQPPEPAVAASRATEVSPVLLERLAQKGQADLWIEFDAQADLRPAYAMGWEARGRFVYDALRELAESSQAETRSYLDDRGFDYTPHWIVNAIFVEGGDAEVVNAARTMEGVARIREPRVLSVPEPLEPWQSPLFLNTQPMAAEWGLVMIDAPGAWNYTRGEGIVVANIDTGVRYTHEALVGHYRGNLGGTFDHDFNWYDPQGNASPSDDHGHGSHTMGTMVGDDGGANQIGVAPGATWIAADGCDGTGCPDYDLTSSAEWMLAPCPIGTAPGDGACDPDLRPHVVNNSWGDCDTSITTFFESQIDAWRAAGIFTAFSNGNTGNCGYSSAFCNSMGNPARHHQVTSVGATTSGDTIASFSLWGPTDDPDPRLTEYANLKPEVSAPGQSVRSSTGDGDTAYGSWSGTSMAAPHVSGLAALMLSVNPGLIGENDFVEDIMKYTADAKPYSTGCGNEGPGNVPNNAFGWGRINALHAVEEAARYADVEWIHVSPTTDSVPVGEATQVEVGFDSTVVESGTYTATLRVVHNDPFADVVVIPLTMTVTKAPPDLGVSKSAPEEVEIGTTLVYTLAVQNDGGSASGLTIRDTLPAEVQFAWADRGGRLEGGEVVWESLSMPGDAAISVRYGVTVSCVTSGTQIVNESYQVAANEWPTPTFGLPITTTARAHGVAADFALPTSPLTHHPLPFTNLTTNATDFSWDFGDGGHSRERHPWHSYDDSGTYTVTLNASNACAGDAASREITIESYDLALSSAPSHAYGDPGEVATFTLTLTNTGTLSETFDLSFVELDWLGKLSTQQVTLDPGSTTSFTATVTVPTNATGGTTEEFFVHGAASTDPRTPPATASTALQATANTEYGVTISAAPDEQEAQPGTTAHHTVEVVNTSNVAATITLTRTNAGWPTTITPVSLTIAPQGIRTVEVAVEVPADASSGAADEATIRASVAGHQQEITLTTHTPGFKIYLPLAIRRR